MDQSVTLSPPHACASTKNDGEVQAAVQLLLKRCNDLFSCPSVAVLKSVTATTPHETADATQKTGPPEQEEEEQFELL